MRLVEVRLEHDRPIRLALHRRLTGVVAPTEDRDRLAAVLGRAWVLAGSELEGVIDAGGYLTPLDPTAVVALDLDGDGLPVVGPDVVPPPDPARHEAQLRAAAAERDRWQVAVDEAVAELEDLQRRREATRAAIEAGRAERHEALQRRDDLVRQRAALAERPSHLARERAVAATAVAAAAARIDEVRHVADRLAAVMGPDGDARHLRNGDDTSEFRAVVERGGSVGAVRPSSLAVSLEWLAHVASGDAPVRSDAATLIRAEADIEHRWQEASSLGVEGAAEVVAARERRDRLSEDRRTLEGLARSGVLGDTARSEIEAAHAAVGRARSAAEVEEARRAEDLALSRYGFDSYLDFTIAMSTRSVGQKAEEKLARIVDELAETEKALEDARRLAAERLERLAEAREPVRRRITDYLGTRPEGPGAPLLALIPEVPPEVAGLTAEVDAALSAAREELVRHEDLLRELDEELAGLTDRLAELDDQIARVDERSGQIENLLTRAEHDADAVATRSEAAERRRRDAEAALSASWRAYEELVDGGAPGYSADDLPPVVEAVAEEVTVGRPHGTPVVLVDTFAPLGPDLLDGALDALSYRLGGTQLVYLTDDRGLVPWARSLSGATGSGQVIPRRGWLQRRLGRRAIRRGPATT
jgi:hypothetical protein